VKPGETLIYYSESKDNRNTMEPIKLGKKMELEYIPFSQLVIPWEVFTDPDVTRDNEHPGVFESGTNAHSNFKPLKTMKRNDLDAVKYSIARFGLLKPFEVAELPEELDYFFGKGKYVIIDGQRRYFAIRELLRLPKRSEEIEQKNLLKTHSEYDQIRKAETQAQEQIAKLSILDYVLIPCLVYPYQTYLQMMRHSVEGNKYTIKPSRDYLEIAEKMHQTGISDLNPDDLSKLWEIRNTIRQEKQAIEKTLQEIRDRKIEGRVEKTKTKHEHQKSQF
jgi:hypothetical protein